MIMSKQGFANYREFMFWDVIFDILIELIKYLWNSLQGSASYIILWTFLISWNDI
jgi:hypothetical protein